MHRRELIDILNSYRDLWVSGRTPHPSWDPPEEMRVLERFHAFVEATPACFERTWAEGHITGSALVVSEDLREVLLTLHGKLNLWLQLGGHSDGHPRPHEVAMREVEEESGLARARFLDYEERLGAAPGAPRPLPFDFDFHQIPARKTEPAHIHFDVRYLVVADRSEPLVITSESKDLRWFPLDEARRVTDERSMHRQFDKLAWLRTVLLQ